jgi:heme-degrading monooxygenase HmoA
MIGATTAPTSNAAREGVRMYLRIEQLHVREGAEAELGTFYRDEALPIFARTPGCRFAALLAPWHAAGHLGLTLWENDDHARVYERSALFQFYLARLSQLLDEGPEEPAPIDPDSVATVDPNETLDNLANRLPVVGFRLDDAAALSALAAPEPARFVRVTSIQLEPLRLEAFRAAYRETIAPEISSHAGCAGTVLAERVGDSSDLRSISIWDREESAVRYELSGASKRLTASVDDLFSPIYEWRLTPPDGIPLGRRELEVTSYTLVAASVLSGGQGTKPRAR